MAGKINMVDAAKFYKGLPGQVKAFEYLDSLLSEEQRTRFQEEYRNNPEPEAPKGDIYIYAKWSGQYDEYGNKVFGMYLMNGTNVVDKIACTSGQSYAQDVVWPTEDTSGSMRPLPEGIYDIGPVDDLGYDPGASDGFGQWVYPLEPRAKIKRSLLRVHSDRNRSTSAGSAGCLCPYSVETMLKFVTWQRMKARPTYLVMDHGLGFLKQEQNFTAPDITKKPSPTAEIHQPAVGEQQTLITMSQVKAIFGREISQSLFDDLNQCLEKFQINTSQRKRHFLAQCCHESGGLQWLKEFASGADYEWRTDLGNTKSGDGKRFKGAGAIQLTGRSNYQAFSDYMQDSRIMEGVDYVAETYPLTSAGYWWHMNNMNAVCDRPDCTVEMISMRVNGTPPNHLAERIEYYEKAKSVIP